MPVRKSALNARALSEAARVRARRELAELDQRRFAIEQVKSRCSQDAVADALGVSQAQISRWLADAKARPRSLAVTVDEILNRKLLGEISAPALLTHLAKVKLAYVNPDKRPHSAWAKVRDAHQSGVLIGQFERGAPTGALAGEAFARPLLPFLLAIRVLVEISPQVPMGSGGLGMCCLQPVCACSTHAGVEDRRGKRRHEPM